MFDKIGDVPAPIVSFYTVVTKSEQAFDSDGVTPVTKSVSFKYYDDNGDERTGTRKDLVFVDKDYVSQVSRDETKGIDDVWLVVNKHKGQRDDIIKNFLLMMDNGEQWEFHDKYIAWLNKKNAVVEITPQKDPVNVGDNGVSGWVDGISPEVKQQMLDKITAEEPQRPQPIDVDEWIADNARELRRAALKPQDVLSEMMINDMVNGTTTVADYQKDLMSQYPSK